MKWIIAAAAIVSAAAFALSVQGGRWWSIAGGFEVGPFGSYRCFGGECSTAGLGWIGGSERWMRTGTGAWAAGLIAMLVLIVVAGGLAAKRVPKLAAKTALVSIATAAITGALFISQFPGVDGAVVDRGIWLFGGAIALGVIACIAVLMMPAPIKNSRADGLR